jgi:hypothetical protein
VEHSIEVPPVHHVPSTRGRLPDIYMGPHAKLEIPSYSALTRVALRDIGVVIGLLFTKSGVGNL